MNSQFRADQVVRHIKTGRFYQIARVGSDGKLYVQNEFARGTISEISDVRPLTRKERGPRG